jgi:hypothetical protein
METRRERFSETTKKRRTVILVCYREALYGEVPREKD